MNTALCPQLRHHRPRRAGPGVHGQLATLAGLPLSATFASIALIAAEAMLLIGLGASFGHLGGPERAWRAVPMWRRKDALGAGLRVRVRGV